MSKDVWQGDYTRPQSLNAWMYVEGDPVNHTDPSGHWSIRPPGMCPKPQLTSLLDPRFPSFFGKDANGSPAVYLYCGYFEITAYQYVVESEYVGIQGYPIATSETGDFQTSGYFIRDVEMNGTGKADVSGTCGGDGGYFSSLYNVQPNGIDAPVSSFGYHCGRGADFDLSDAYKVVAADRDILPQDAEIYVPTLETNSDPQGNAFFKVKDTGGVIRGKHIDVFVGEGAGILSPNFGQSPALRYGAYHTSHGVLKYGSGLGGGVYQKVPFPYSLTWWHWCLDETWDN